MNGWIVNIFQGLADNFYGSFIRQLGGFEEVDVFYYLFVGYELSGRGQLQITDEHAPGCFSIN